MFVNLISDLHLEFRDLTLPGGDVLILGGDVVEAKHVHHDRYIRFFNEECSKYRHVIYVMGNHEHYGFKFDQTYNQLKQHLPTNVHLLEKEHVEIDGTVFVGATLWTDCNKGDPITVHSLKDMMNDYRVITYHDKHKDVYFRLTPAVTMADHARAKEYIRTIALQHTDKNIVVVTHHGPSYQSIHPRFRSDFAMNGGFSSELSAFMLEHPNIKVWTHGHTHDPHDYTVGHCRVMCNPRGYAGYEEQARLFDPSIGFDI